MSPGQKFRQALKDEKPLQVPGAINAYHATLVKASGFRAQRLHRTRFVESLKRSAQRRHGKNRRVTDLPAIS